MGDIYIFFPFSSNSRGGRTKQKVSCLLNGSSEYLGTNGKTCPSPQWARILAAKFHTVYTRTALEKGAPFKGLNCWALHPHLCMVRKSEWWTVQGQGIVRQQDAWNWGMQCLWAHKELAQRASVVFHREMKQTLTIATLDTRTCKVSWFCEKLACEHKCWQHVLCTCMCFETVTS